jgi:hypothetical protein
MNWKVVGLLVAGFPAGYDLLCKIFPKAVLDNPPWQVSVEEMRRNFDRAADLYRRDWLSVLHRIHGTMREPHCVFGHAQRLEIEIAIKKEMQVLIAIRQACPRVGFSWNSANFHVEHPSLAKHNYVGGYFLDILSGSSILATILGEDAKVHDVFSSLLSVLITSPMGSAVRLEILILVEKCMHHIEIPWSLVQPHTRYLAHVLASYTDGSLAEVVAAIRLVDTAIETIPEAADELLQQDVVGTFSRLLLVLGCADSMWVLPVDSIDESPDIAAQDESCAAHDTQSVDVALLEAKRMCLVTLLHLLRQSAGRIESTPVFPAHVALLSVWQKLPYLAASFSSFHSPIILAVTELVYEVTMQIEPYFSSAVVLCTSLAAHAETIRPDGSAALGLEQVVGKIYDLLEALGHLLIWRLTYQKDVDHLSTLCSSLLQKLALLQAAATTMRVPSNVDPAEPEKNGTAFQTEVKWAHIRHQVWLDRCRGVIRCVD